MIAAALIAAAIGTVCASVAGYIVYALSFGSDRAVRFGAWLQEPIFYQSWAWPIIGALAGLGILAIQALTRR